MRNERTNSDDTFILKVILSFGSFGKSIHIEKVVN